VLASEQNRPDVARRRTQWRQRQASIDPTRLVFIDETWTKTNMAPLRGWAERGRRLRDQVPHGRWKTLTFLAALRHDRLTAPCLFDGPINGESFRAYVEQILLPTLKRGDIVVIISARTKATRSARQSDRRGHGGCFCRPTHPTLIPSSRSSQNSRRCCARPGREHATP
jgi:hypothetical protein